MMDDNSSIGDGKDTEVYHSGRESDGKGEEWEKFDPSQCTRMFIPSYGFVQKKNGKIQPDSTKKLLDDAISIQSSQDDEVQKDESQNEPDLKTSKSTNSEKSERVRKKHHISKCRQVARHKHLSLKGKERQIDQNSPFHHAEASGSRLCNEGQSERGHRDTTSGKRRKRERINSDRCIKNTIQALSAEIDMEQKEILLRACKLLLTSKSPKSEHQEDAE